MAFGWLPDRFERIGDRGIDIAKVNIPVTVLFTILRVGVFVGGNIIVLKLNGVKICKFKLSFESRAGAADAAKRKLGLYNPFGQG